MLPTECIKVCYFKVAIEQRVFYTNHYLENQVAVYWQGEMSSLTKS